MSCITCLFGLHIKLATILQILEKKKEEKKRGGGVTNKQIRRMASVSKRNYNHRNRKIRNAEKLSYNLRIKTARTEMASQSGGGGGGGRGGGYYSAKPGSLTGARRPRVRRRVVQCLSVLTHTTLKRVLSGCFGTTGRSAERLPFLVAVPS